MNDMLKLGEDLYPQAAKQKYNTWYGNYSDPTDTSGITGKVFVLVWGIKQADIPEDSIIKWAEKGYEMIAERAIAKTTITGKSIRDQIKSTTWQIVFNQPKVLVISTNRCDDFVFGVMKFCLSHGVHVVLSDSNAMLDRQVFKPVRNLYNDKLFKLYKIEEYDMNTLPHDKRIKAKEKLQQLHNHREAFMNKLIYPKLNKAMYQLTEFYREDRQVQWFEYIESQKVLALQDAALSFGYGKPDAAAIKTMLETVQTWGQAFDIQAQSEPRDNNIDNYKVSKQYKHHAGWQYSRATEVIFAVKNRMQYNSIDAAQLLKDYEQIIWYLNNDPEQWLATGWSICEVCEQPLNLRDEYCACGQQNYNVLDAEIPSSMLPGFEFRA